MHRLRYFLPFAVTPGFLALAAINIWQPSPLCTVPGSYGFLSSMWFMCLMMAFAHCGPWLTLTIPSRSLARTWRQRLEKQALDQGPALECSDAALRERAPLTLPAER